MNAGLSPQDWNFDEVPEPELAACCLWEYARESETLLAATTAAVRREANGWAWERTPAAMEAIHRVLDLPSDEQAPLYQLLAVFDGGPWSELAPADRTRYAAMIPREVTPMRAACLEEVAALLAANRTIPQENIERARRLGIPESELKGDKIKRGPFDSVDALRLAAVLDQSRLGDWRKGCSVVALTVDFAHYGDRELGAVFQKMLPYLRPPELAAPKRAPVFARRKGNQLNRFRVALHRLGVARLVKHFGPDADKFPEAARKLYRGRIYDRQKRELEHADEFFRKLFPSLAGERMLCRRKNPAGAVAPRNPSNF